MLAAGEHKKKPVLHTRRPDIARQRDAISPNYAKALLDSVTLFNAMIKQCFSDFDSDQNGQLDPTELSKALEDFSKRTFGLDESFFSVDQILENYDADSNGRLDP